MVPRLLMRSALVMPMPVSTIVSVRSFRLGVSSILRSLHESSLLGSVKLSYLILSNACFEDMHCVIVNFGTNTGA